MINSIRQTILTITVCFAAISGYDCGSPLEPADSLWKAVASLSGYHCNDLQCGPDGSVYIASDNSIYRFEDGDFTVYAEFGDDWYITQFALDGGGVALLDNDYLDETALFQKIGDNWSELQVPDDIFRISGLSVINNDYYFIYGLNTDWSNVIYAYNRGNWRFYDVGPDVFPKAICSDSVGAAYIIAEDYEQEYGLVLLIIDDNKGMYVEEPVIFKDGHIKLAGNRWGFAYGEASIAYWGNSLYYVTGIYSNGINSYSLIKREGAQGEGKWIPEVIIPEKSPDTGTLESVAFDGRGRAMLCGNETSIVSEGDGIWQKELFDYDIGYLRGSPTGGFWGTCRGDLYYHP